MSKAGQPRRDPMAAPAGGPARALVLAAYAACVVAALYALVSFYWALGGTARIDTLGGKLEELARDGDPVVLWLAGAAGVLKVAGAVLALALVRPWGRLVPRRLLLVAAWAGSVVLVVYGGLYVVAGALVLAGVVDVSGRWTARRCGGTCWSGTCGSWSGGCCSAWPPGSTGGAEVAPAAPGRRRRSPTPAAGSAPPRSSPAR
jgi:hypothetical protein